MTNGKKDILIIMGRYLPGYKDGGPVRTIKNLVDYLGNEYNFKILTCDRDHGDIEPYRNIKIKEWNKVGNALVYYVPPKGFKYSLIKKLSLECDLIYCCGCFNDYAINTLVLKRIGLIKVPVVVASMGLFSPMGFRLKYKKKKIFVSVFNILGMFKNIYWSATSKMEVEKISQQIKIENNYFIAEDLPRMIDKYTVFKEKQKGELKIVWISRIAPNKNLLGAINILKQVKSNISFTIYGPKQDIEYWNKCEKELNKLPNNIKWKWNGNVDSEIVIETLKQHHIFLFPTLGENYGHVIQEALSAGCPVILSDQTPWKDFGNNGIGYVYSLDNYYGFVKCIEKYANMNEEQFNFISNEAIKYIYKKSINKGNETGYKVIFDSL